MPSLKLCTKIEKYEFYSIMQFTKKQAAKIYCWHSVSGTSEESCWTKYSNAMDGSFQQDSLCTSHVSVQQSNAKQKLRTESASVCGGYVSTTKLSGIMAEWCCWPCICMTSADERKGTENRWRNAIYHWLQEMSRLTKCKITTLHDPHSLKYIQCTPSSKNSTWCTTQK